MEFPNLKKMLILQKKRKYLRNYAAQGVFVQYEVYKPAPLPNPRQSNRHLGSNSRYEYLGENSIRIEIYKHNLLLDCSLLCLRFDPQQVLSFPRGSTRYYHQ